MVAFPKGDSVSSSFLASLYEQDFVNFRFRVCKSSSTFDKEVLPTVNIVCEYFKMCSDQDVASILTFVSFFIHATVRFHIKDASLAPMRDMTIVFLLGFFNA